MHETCNELPPIIPESETVRARHPRTGRRRRVRRGAGLRLLLVAASLLAAPAALACPSALSGRTLAIDPATRGFGSVQKLPPLPLEAGEYVLTIDDGPSRKSTEALLGILAERCVAATFFLVGRNAEREPALVRRIVVAGQGIGSHTYSHADFSKLTRDEIAAEVWGGMRAVETAAYGAPDRSAKPRLFRFAGGGGMPAAPPAAMMDIARQTGAVVAGYDFSPEDWRNSPPDESLRRLLPRLRDRGVIIVHDGQSNTLKLLPMILDELERRRARVVRLTVGAAE